MLKNKGLLLGLAILLALLTPFAGASPISGNSVTVTAVTPGNAQSNLGKAEDGAENNAATGVLGLTVRRDTPATSSGNTGDYSTLNTSGDGALYTQQIPSTANGYSLFRSIDLDESEEEVKGTAGQLYGCNVTNDTAATKEYLKIYDGTAAGVTVGTTTPVITVPLAAAAAQVRIDFPMGIPFTTGITMAATTGIADNDTGAPAANAVIVNCWYK